MACLFVDIMSSYSNDLRKVRTSQGLVLAFPGDRGLILPRLRFFEDDLDVWNLLYVSKFSFSSLHSLLPTLIFNPSRVTSVQFINPPMLSFPPVFRHFFIYFTIFVSSITLYFFNDLYTEKGTLQGPEVKCSLTYLHPGF